ncbi:hypothetical protein HFN55_20010 [Rhizobium leguminosarum]|nr:hypothetical protein [Rhizobium leguminosarum]
MKAVGRKTATSVNADQILADLLIRKRAASLDLSCPVGIRPRFGKGGLGACQCGLLVTQFRAHGFVGKPDEGLSFRDNRTDIDKDIDHTQAIDFRGHDSLMPGFQPAAGRYRLGPPAFYRLCHGNGKRCCLLSVERPQALRWK